MATRCYPSIQDTPRNSRLSQSLYSHYRMWVVQVLYKLSPFLIHRSSISILLSLLRCSPSLFADRSVSCCLTYPIGFLSLLNYGKPMLVQPDMYCRYVLKRKSCQIDCRFRPWVNYRNWNDQLHDGSYLGCFQTNFHAIGQRMQLYPYLALAHHST